MILFVSPTIVKRDTMLGSQVDDNIILPQIRLAQDKEILPYLGTKLTEKIQSDIESDILAGSYKELVDDYIIPALTQFTFVLTAPALRVRFSNNSVTVVTSEQGQSASQSDIKHIVDTARNMGEFYRQRMIDRIRYHMDEFPEYNQNENEDLHPTSRNYFEGLNIGTRRVDNQQEAFLHAIGAKGII